MKEQTEQEKIIGYITRPIGFVGLLRAEINSPLYELNGKTHLKFISDEGVIQEKVYSSNNIPDNSPIELTSEQIEKYNKLYENFCYLSSEKRNEIVLNGYNNYLSTMEVLLT